MSSKWFLVAAIAAAVSIAGLAFGTASARAWAWDPSVTLQGTANCGIPQATWVYVRASDGEQGWATYGTGHYRFNFHGVPYGGMTVHVTYGEPGVSCHSDFGVSRPAFGTTATRNVIQIIPNG